jgi:chemotaxis protein CheX
VDVKNVNPFVESFAEIMPQLGFGNVQKGILSVKGQELVNSGVIIIIGIVGAIRGNVVYAITQENAKKIASTMMMGMPVYELDEIPMSAIGELANMLTATAATCFSNLGVSIDISSPAILHGENMSAKMSSSQVLCIQLFADDIPIEINIAFEN